MSRMIADTRRCIEDYGVRARSSPHERQRLELMATFAGVELDTVRHWVAGDRPPIGETLLKIRCYLWISDRYTVREFKALPVVTRRLALIIATDVLSLDEVVGRLGYKNRGAVLDIILRGGSPMRDKFFKIDRIVNDYGDALDRAIEEWKTRIAAVLEDVSTSDEAALDQPKEPARKAAVSAEVHADKAVAHLISALEALVAETDDVHRLTEYVRTKVPVGARNAVGTFLINTL